MSETAQPNETPPDSSVVPLESLAWATMAPGIEIRMLRVGGDSGNYTLMTRFAPGTVLPRHRHRGEVHAYTIQGRWFYKEYDWVAEAGSYIYEPPGSVHTLSVSEDNDGPTLVIFTIDQGLELLDDTGKVIHVEEAHSMQAMYAMVLQNQGDPPPDAVLP